MLYSNFEPFRSFRIQTQNLDGQNYTRFVTNRLWHVISNKFFNVFPNICPTDGCYIILENLSNRVTKERVCHRWKRKLLSNVRFCRFRGILE